MVLGTCFENHCSISFWTLHEGHLTFPYSIQACFQPTGPILMLLKMSWVYAFTPIGFFPSSKASSIPCSSESYPFFKTQNECISCIDLFLVTLAPRWGNSARCLRHSLRKEFILSNTFGKQYLFKVKQQPLLQTSQNLKYATTQHDCSRGDPLYFCRGQLETFCSHSCSPSYSLNFFLVLFYFVFGLTWGMRKFLGQGWTLESQLYPEPQQWHC